MIKAAQKTVDMVGHFVSLQIDKGLRDAAISRCPWNSIASSLSMNCCDRWSPKTSRPDSITPPMLIDKVTDGCSKSWVLLKIDIEGIEFDVAGISAQAAPSVFIDRRISPRRS